MVQLLLFYRPPDFTSEMSRAWIPACAQKEWIILTLTI